MQGQKTQGQIYNILVEAERIAKETGQNEIAEKIDLALEKFKVPGLWESGFAVGYYASWAERMANQQQPGTPLCHLLNDMINLLEVRSSG